MPTVSNVPLPGPPLDARGETFARGRAAGLSRQAAFRAAGYARSGKGAAKLEARPSVQARIKELEALAPRLVESGLLATAIALADAARRGREEGGQAALREVRLTLLAANHLQGLNAQSQAAQAPKPPPPRDLTDEEWMARHGAK
jgi:hypothetical protein